MNLLSNARSLSRKISHVLLFSFFIVSLSGWSLFKPASTSLEEDKANLNKVLDGFFVTYWKGAKLSVRALPIKQQMSLEEFEQAQQEHKKNLPFGEQLSTAYNWEGVVRGIEAGREKLSVQQFTDLAKDIYAIPSVIKTKDEDDYPTFFEVIANTRSLLQQKPIALPENWNASMEHWLFALAMEAQLGFKSWKTYELQRVKPHELHTTDLQTLALIHQGIDHLRHSRYYLAEDTFTQSLTILNNSPKDAITLLPHSERFFALFTKEGTTQERFHHYMSGLNYLLRGYSRQNMNNEKASQLAQQDMAQTVSHFNQSGIDNEFTWLAQSYVYIEQKETDKAVATLEKLANSSLLADKEKALLAKAQQQLTNQQPDKALASLADSHIMYKLGMNYATSYLSEVTWTKLLEQTEEGKQLFKHFIGLQEQFEKIKGYLTFI